MGPAAAEAIVVDVRERLRARVVDPEIVIDSIRRQLLSRLEQTGAAVATATSGPTVILVTGVNGSGKTTSIAKLARLFTRDGKRVVLGAPQADLLVVSARSSGSPDDTHGISLFIVAANARGVTTTPYRNIDNQRAADVKLDGVQLRADALVGAEGGALAAIEEAVDFATALQCAEAVGAMQFANDTTLEYLKTRKQFGAPIGTFQVLQHRMVEMFVTVEQARSMTYLVCSRVDSATDATERARIVSAAKIKIADACRQISQESVQLHGGMGMTEEMKVSHTFRRLTMIAQQFGDADHHLDRFATLDDTGRAAGA
jgi:alkylation response protein AidB-like acyl-CoA dehydrogenase